MRRPLWTLPLLAVAVAWGQAALTPEQVRSTGLRCVQVGQTIQAIEAAKAPVPADLQTARQACDAAERKQADAGATLDRLSLTSLELFTRMEQAASRLTGLPRFYVLAGLARNAFDLAKPEKARLYARELLQMASQYPDDWNYGNAIYYGYFVLGRVALEDGNLALAGQYLMNAASTPGSPQLNSFGPNMTLAKELLEKGQFAVVGQFLTQCKTFWKMDRGNLDTWIGLVQHGKIPAFGANLNY
jgi:hypothetical protein